MDISLLSPHDHDARQQAACTLALAFQDDILKTAFIADQRTRADLAAWVFRGAARDCLAYGEVHATPGFEGVALWLPPEACALTLGRMLLGWNSFPSTFLRLELKTMRSFLALNHLSEVYQRRLAPFPHWYLEALGVRPEYQGQGYGGALLDYMLPRLDREGLPCYLETQTARNAVFYQRRGFVILDEVSFGSLRIWFMLRRASSKTF